jgi:multiple sugar transport system permease protein
MKMSKRARKSIRIFFVTVVGLILALPLIYLLSGSFMSAAQISAFPPQFFPSSLHFGNYSQAWSYLQIRSAVNSIIFTVGAVGLQWMLCISGGLAISKMRFEARNKITGVFGITLFVPAITTLVPTFIVTDKLHMVNTYPGLIIPIAAQTGFGSLLFRQYIINLPEELFDAARMEGANWWKILRRIVIPLTKPATAAYAAISVLTAWNMYLWPLVVANKPSVEVLTESLAPLASGGLAGYGNTITENVAFAATVITTLPMLIAFLVVQPAFVRGLSGSGVE